MATELSPKPSFSRAHRWSIGLNVVFSVAALLTIVVMVNYLSSRYFRRFFLSTQTQIELHAPTVSLLRSLTNEIQVTLYYNKDDPFYGDIADLLKEYHSKNRQLQVRKVDYEREPGLAQEIKAKYNLGSETYLIVFDCAGKTRVVSGDMLVDYKLTLLPEGYDRKPVFFKGEMMFTSALLAVTSAKPFKACYLQGHGEHGLADSGGGGYTAFAGVIQQNYIQIDPLSLLGTNTVPDDCHLLIIAGPITPLPEVELKKIEQYLNRGGRLFALFNWRTANQPTGVENILTQWGVKVGNDLAVDPESLVRGQDVVISAFSQHPLVNPLLTKGLYWSLPRPVFRLPPPAQAADAPKVEVVASTGGKAYLSSDAAQRKNHLPVMVIVDKPSVKGVVFESGATRMIVAGDSFFLSNGQINEYANRSFANLAANWLLDRSVLLEGLSPKPVVEYRLLIPKGQRQTLQWILLGAMPGGVLLFGGLVWLRRRK